MKVIMVLSRGTFFLFLYIWEGNCMNDFAVQVHCTRFKFIFSVGILYYVYLWFAVIYGYYVTNYLIVYIYTILHTLVTTAIFGMQNILMLYLHSCWSCSHFYLMNKWITNLIESLNCLMQTQYLPTFSKLTSRAISLIRCWRLHWARLSATMDVHV